MKGITVFTASLARRLLAQGYKIIDIKQDKQDPDGKRSLFVFKDEEGLQEIIDDIKKARERDELLRM